MKKYHSVRWLKNDKNWNDIDQCDLINKIKRDKIINQKGEDKGRVIIQTEYHNPFTFILKHAKTWAEVNKSYEVHL